MLRLIPSDNYRINQPPGNLAGQRKGKTMANQEIKTVIVSYYSRTSGATHRCCEVKHTTPKGWLKIVFEGHPVTLRPEKYRENKYRGTFCLGHIEAIPFDERVWADLQKHMQEQKEEKEKEVAKRKAAKEEAEAEQRVQTEELKSKLHIDFDADVILTEEGRRILQVKVPILGGHIAPMFDDVKYAFAMICVQKEDTKWSILNDWPRFDWSVAVCGHSSSGFTTFRGHNHTVEDAIWEALWCVAYKLW